MRKYISLIGLFFIAITAFSQKMTISGVVYDTVAKAPLQYSVVMAIRLKGSILVAHTRTDTTGHFELKNLTIDTLQIIIANTRFDDQSIYLFGSITNNKFNLGKIILPPKNHQLKEVIIYAFKDPIYYKGDTLIYAADSFKVKHNATVEDLLKKLPGIQVDQKGGIKFQGKDVGQVLVDGDEFFGSDLTIATKNLEANNIESIQVYEKKNDGAEENNDEKIQVLNLKMKDEAKKGYFGKISVASNCKDFYEGSLLANKFTNTRKTSIFSLGSNTPNSSINLNDATKYGLDNDSNSQMDENGNNPGIPRVLKSGIYYNEKTSKNTILGFNYTYNNNQLEISSDTRSEYFLTDSSYVTQNVSNKIKKSEKNAFNFKYTQALDSLTELIIEPKLNLNSVSQHNYQLTSFLTPKDILIHQTAITTTNTASGYDFNTDLKVNRKFKNRDRSLNFTYIFFRDDNKSKGLLKSYDSFYNPVLLNDSINQQKTNISNTLAHNVIGVYTEPLTKKIKLELEYLYNNSIGKQNKKTQNYFNGEYTIYDSLYTNNFENSRITNRLGAKLIYEIKKQLFNIGGRIRNVSIVNSNLITNGQIKQSINNILPYLGYTYQFNQRARFTLKYYTTSNQPTIKQLQPIPDNSNPNRIIAGNPNLLPTFSHNFNVFYNIYKPISEKYLWLNADYSITNNAFANSIIYDSIGRVIIKTVNVNGNSYANAIVGVSLPFFKKVLVVGGFIRLNYYNYSSYINNQKNNTENLGINNKFAIAIQLDTIEFSLSCNYDYNSPSSSLNNSSNKPFSQQKYNASIRLKLPFKLMVETELEYTINNQRAIGYNINYILWNVSLSKTILKNENLILSLICKDILNQNINTTRFIWDNVITDNKTNIISRYFLLSFIYKFNSTKTKDMDDFY